MKKSMEEVLSEVVPAVTEVDQKFWKINSDNNGAFKGFTIDKLKFIEFLYSLGFRRFDIDKASIFILIDNNIVSEVTTTQIIDTVESYLHNKYGEEKLGEAGAKSIYLSDLISSIYNRLTQLFSEDLLFRLRSKHEIVFNTDTRDEKFLYFKNGFVTVTKDGFSFSNYSNLRKAIWKNMVLAHEFDEARNTTGSVFEQYVSLIAGQDIERKRSMESIIGYGTHFYFETKLKGIVLTDSALGNHDEANGRTGKTLLCKAIGYSVCSDTNNPMFTTFCEVNGKDFDPEASTKYQQASIDTRIIVLNDVKAGFDVECLYNDITEGVMVKRLYQHPFRSRVKLFILSNKTVKIEGPSSKDRFVEFEFSNFFNEKHSPESHFKQWFFRDWDKKEWNRFYGYLIQCCQLYFEKGIISPKEINLSRRKLREQTHPDFVEWIDSQDIQHWIENSIAQGVGIQKNEFFDKFIGEYRDQSKWLKQIKFTKWIQYWCKYGESGITVEDGRSMVGREYRFNRKTKQP